MALPPLQNLLDLLPDNTEGLIEPVDLRSIVTDLYGGVSDNSNTFIGYVRTDGAVTMDDGYTPSDTLSVATKGYVDSVLFPENFVQKTGDTMSGDLFLPLYLPTEYGQAAHKGYVDSAVTSGAQGAVTTDTTNYSLITPTPNGVKIRGLKPSQNVVLTDDGTDIVIKANVQGTGGDVRTDVNNVFDPNTVQTFDKIDAQEVEIQGVNVGDKITQNEQDISQLAIEVADADAAAAAAQATANAADAAATVAQTTADAADSKADANTAAIANLPTPVEYIVAQSTSGNTGYRRYNTGRVSQWGFGASTTQFNGKIYFPVTIDESKLYSVYVVYDNSASGDFSPLIVGAKNGQFFELSRANTGTVSWRIDTI